MIDLFTKIIITGLTFSGVCCYLAYMTVDWRKERIRKLNLAMDISLAVTMLVFLIKIWSM